MQTAALLAYVGTIVVLAITPGPSVMLGSAHGMRYGAKGTLPTIAGDLTANTFQIVAAAVGLGALITGSAAAFTVVKWAGVGYLAWLGISHLRRVPDGAKQQDSGAHRGPMSRFAQGFVTSASNPKAIVFFAALFPQFVNTAGTAAPIAIQFVVLGSVFLVIDGLTVFLYAAFAGSVSRWLSNRGRMAVQHRITGFAMLSAASLLSLKGAPTPSR